MKRRTVLKGAAGLAGASVAFNLGMRGKRYFDQPKARVFTARAAYDPALKDTMIRGLRAFPDTLARVKGGRVVLKPNLVEFDPGRPINTDARFVHAAVEAFRFHGAREVIVAEGPGHFRDTEALIEWTGLDHLLRDTGARFVDLNVDRVVKTALPRNLTGLGALQLPETVLDADLFVSLAKLKTHHWAGVTLSMKNLFGVVPGAVYGWPKNVLHYAGLLQSILDLWLTLPDTFALIDGVVGMEGDGPIMGSAVDAGIVVMGDQLPATDAVAARYMGLDPGRIAVLGAAARLGGTVSSSRIEREGDLLDPLSFAVLPEFEHLRLRV